MKHIVEKLKVKEDFAQEAAQEQKELSFRVAKGESLNYRISTNFAEQSTAPTLRQNEADLFSLFDIEEDEEQQEELRARNYKGVLINTWLEYQFILYVCKMINTKYLRTDEERAAFLKYGSRTGSSYDTPVLSIVAKDFLRFAKGADGKERINIGAKDFKLLESTLENLSKRAQYYIYKDARGRDCSDKYELISVRNKRRVKENKGSNLESFEVLPNPRLFQDIVETFALVPADYFQRLQRALRANKMRGSALLERLSTLLLYQRGISIKQHKPYKEELSTFLNRLPSIEHYRKARGSSHINWKKLEKELEAAFYIFNEAKLIEGYKFTTSANGKRQFEVTFSKGFLLKDTREKEQAALPDATGKETEETEEQAAPSPDNTKN